ncbi:hypothetical protein MTR67_044666 [Solanum verrucosum]|uniref:Non-haem dioxygenase N-terminal domain-containing protein n=1 Tax=Solanum verrucosum TaxID=315347 RepID=A0AAF0UUD5_SOLVR|nr:hypothetical protein MTR67_044666 [Solanum verrucosum]
MKLFIGGDADLVHQVIEKVKVIQERLKTSQSHQKSYPNVRRRELEVEVDDWVYVKVSPMKGVMRFGKKGKLSHRYIGPYRIYKRIDNVAYELELPQELAAVHPIFHISMLNEYMGDPSLIIPTEDIGINDSLLMRRFMLRFSTARGFFSADPFAAQQASRLVGEACRSHGFFLIVNHGVDANLISNAHRYMDMFFDMPLYEKKKAQRKIGEHCGYASSFAGRFSS